MNHGGGLPIEMCVCRCLVHSTVWMNTYPLLMFVVIMGLMEGVFENSHGGLCVWMSSVLWDWWCGDKELTIS